MGLMKAKSWGKMEIYMGANTILIAFLILLTFYVAVELFLLQLNLKYVRARRAAVPEFFADFIDQATYQRSVDYTLSKGNFARVELIFSGLLLLLVLLTGFFGIADRHIARLNLGTYWHGVVFVLGLSLLSSIIESPLSLYKTFVIEERFGFNKMTLKLWFLDFLKGFALSVVLLTPLLLAVFWFMDRAGTYWWIYAFCMIAGFQLLLLFLYPVFIAPIFNKFEALPEGELRNRVFTLSEKLDFPVKELRLMDGSKRSGHGNAYFTGFGRNKRIVFFDTLIEALSIDQVVAVLAHEIGHQKLGHVKKGIMMSLAGLFLSLWVLSCLIDYEVFYLAFGFENPSSYAALVVFSFASGPLLFFLSPLFSMLSRRHEYQADAFAINAVGESESLETALLTLSKKSLGNLTPHPWYSFFHYSHPTLYERILAMRNLQGTK